MDQQKKEEAMPNILGQRKSMLLKELRELEERAEEIRKKLNDLRNVEPEDYA